MKNIKKQIHIKAPTTEVFQRFVNDVGLWWPRSYTWFENPNTSLKIDLGETNLCTEVDNNGDSVTWGRIINFNENDSLEILWLIVQDRNEIEKDHRASRVRVTFSEDSEGNTDVELTHSDFDKLGSGAEEYYRTFESDDGWIYLLRQFKTYCHSQHQPA